MDEWTYRCQFQNGDRPQSAESFHKGLLPAFINAYEAADAISSRRSFAEISDFLWEAIDGLELCMQGTDYLPYFRSERLKIAAACHDSPTLIGPDGKHYPSYHDAAFYVAHSFVVRAMDLIDGGTGGPIKPIVGYALSQETVESGELLRRIEGWPEQFNSIASEYCAAMQSEAASLIVAQVGQNAASTSANIASASRLFSGNIPSNPDVVDLAVKIDAAAGTGASRNEIARQHTCGDERKAQSLLASIRRLEKQRRLTLRREQ